MCALTVVHFAVGVVEMFVKCAGCLCDSSCACVCAANIVSFLHGVCVCTWDAHNNQYTCTGTEMIFFRKVISDIISSCGADFIFSAASGRVERGVAEFCGAERFKIALIHTLCA